MSGTKGPITTFIVEPFVPHSDEYYLSIVSDRLGASVSFSECGGIEIEENWDKVRQGFLWFRFNFYKKINLMFFLCLSFYKIAQTGTRFLTDVSGRILGQVHLHTD
jgi:hypothetical protein